MHDMVTVSHTESLHMVSFDLSYLCPMDMIKKMMTFAYQCMQTFNDKFFQLQYQIDPLRSNRVGENYFGDGWMGFICLKL